MPLVRGGTVQLIGTDLELQPLYGWGWQPHYPWDHLPKARLPPRSTLRLEGLTEFNGDISGGFGRIVASVDAPDFCGHWLCFEIRVETDADLNDAPVNCSLALRRDPPIDSAAEANGAWDRYDFCGFGLVGTQGFLIPGPPTGG